MHNPGKTHTLPPGGLLLLDGGLATELETKGFDLNHKLWSAKLLLENPQAIIDAHLAYLRAGAQCIISASYQASITGFMQLGLTREKAVQAMTSSIDLARKAIDQFCTEQQPHKMPLLAASIGPYGACQADGSEYHGNYGVDEKLLVEFHRERLKILAATDVDILACETIPSLSEARVLNTLLAQQPKPAWVSFSCRDGEHLNDGNPIVDTTGLFSNNSQVFALGVNCTPPQYINSLIDRLKMNTDKAIVVYPNSGEHFQADTKTWHGTADPQECARAAIGWVEHGASIIGGCCRMGPEHIKAIGAMIEFRQSDQGA